jgi:hypothetical protein
MVPVFADDRITLQMVRIPAPPLSAAVAAWLEVHVEDQDRRNALCTPGVLPDTVGDYPKSELSNLQAQAAWASEPALRRWIRDSRLDGFGRVVEGVSPEEADKMAILGRMRAAVRPAMVNLERLAAGTPA